MIITFKCIKPWNPPPPSSQGILDSRDIRTGFKVKSNVFICTCMCGVPIEPHVKGKSRGARRQQSTKVFAN